MDKIMCEKRNGEEVGIFMNCLNRDSISFGRKSGIFKSNCKIVYIVISEFTH